ncbi:MAG: hypothetical protein F6K32_15055 [Desertifilum sp. SIO1I2]|nr:hypothetical protein [Desertifilum sp. SIO1I2]
MQNSQNLMMEGVLVAILAYFSRTHTRPDATLARSPYFGLLALDAIPENFTK